MRKTLTIIIAMLCLYAGSTFAQTAYDGDQDDAMINMATTLGARIDSLRAEIAALKKGGVGVTLADVRREIKDRSVELEHIRPNGAFATFKKALRNELNGLNDSIDDLERASAHPKRGERKAAIRTIRANRGW